MTSQYIASLAAKVLRDPKSTAIEKSIAGSALSQRRKKANCSRSKG